MASEIPQPERYRRPEGGVFNLFAMTGDQVVALGRALFALAYAKVEQNGEGTPMKDAGDYMWHALAVDIGRTAAQHSEHGRKLLLTLTTSDHDHDLKLAANALPTVAESDYELARDTLLALDRHVSELPDSEADVPVSLAVFLAVDYMCEELPSEQSTELRSRYEAQTPGDE
jgi:hypothetical protein